MPEMGQDPRRRALKNIQRVHDRRNLGYRLDGARARADDAHALSDEVHGVIPLGSVHDGTFEGGETVDVRKSRFGESARREKYAARVVLTL